MQQCNIHSHLACGDHSMLPETSIRRLSVCLLPLYSTTPGRTYLCLPRATILNQNVQKQAAPAVHSSKRSINDPRGSCQLTLIPIYYLYATITKRVFISFFILQSSWRSASVCRRRQRKSHPPNVCAPAPAPTPTPPAAAAGAVPALECSLVACWSVRATTIECLQLTKKKKNKRKELVATNYLINSLAICNFILFFMPLQKIRFFLHSIQSRILSNYFKLSKKFLCSARAKVANINK